MIVLVLLAGVFVCSFLLTGALRQYAIVNQVLDVPNVRSSHTHSTPRGGGLAIVISFSVALFFLYGFDRIDLNLFLAFSIGGWVVGGIGFVDDHRHISAGWRILVHILVALWAIYCLSSYSATTFSVEIINYDIFIYLLTLFFIVWLLNLYNFMDGIDGIASVEAMTTASAAALIIYFTSAQTGENLDYIILLLILVVAVCGFSIWNWPPAKIFLGDVGSGYLGYIFSLFAISTTIDNVMSIWAWFILLGVFIVDATITLLRRFFEGKRWYEAHRSHAYQHATQRWNSHRKVTLSVLLINIVWLFPLAWLATLKSEWGLWLTIFAYLPLIVLALYLKAGRVAYL